MAFINFRSRLYQFLYYFIVITVLTILLIIIVIQILLNLQLTGQAQVIRVNPPWSSSQNSITIFLSPSIENTGKESGMSLLDFFVIWLDDYLLVEIVLDSVSKY
jgi:hypothetical protein